MPQIESPDWLEMIAKVLLRCFVFGCLFLLLWFAFYVLAEDVMHRMHGRLFGFSKHEMALIHYCGMAYVKVCVILFFLFPYIAVRLVLRKTNA